MDSGLCGLCSILGAQGYMYAHLRPGRRFLRVCVCVCVWMGVWMGVGVRRCLAMPVHTICLRATARCLLRYCGCPMFSCILWVSPCLRSTAKVMHVCVCIYIYIYVHGHVYNFFIHIHVHTDIHTHCVHACMLISLQYRFLHSVYDLFIFYVLTYCYFSRHA